MYHFVHEESPARERRNIDILHPKHNHLAAEEHVSIIISNTTIYIVEPELDTSITGTPIATSYQWTFGCTHIDNGFWLTNCGKVVVTAAVDGYLSYVCNVWLCVWCQVLAYMFSNKDMLWHFPSSTTTGLVCRAAGCEDQSEKICIQHTHWRQLAQSVVPGESTNTAMYVYQVV